MPPPADRSPSGTGFSKWSDAHPSPRQGVDGSGGPRRAFAWHRAQVEALAERAQRELEAWSSGESADTDALAVEVAARALRTARRHWWREAFGVPYPDRMSTTVDDPAVLLALERIAFVEALLFARAAQLVAAPEHKYADADRVVPRNQRAMRASIRTFLDVERVQRGVVARLDHDGQRIRFRLLMDRCEALADAVRAAGLPADITQRDSEALLTRAWNFGIAARERMATAAPDRAEIGITLSGIAYHASRSLRPEGQAWHRAWLVRSAQAAEDAYRAMVPRYRAVTAREWSQRPAESLDLLDRLVAVANLRATVYELLGDTRFAGPARAHAINAAQVRAECAARLARTTMGAREIARRSALVASAFVNARVSERLSSARHTNCQRAVVAGLAWSSGVPIPAEPERPGTAFVINLAAAYRTAYGAELESCADAGAIVARLHEAGPGAKGIVFIRRPDRVGHVCVAENIAGKVFFVEYQDGRIFELDATGRHIQGEWGNAKYHLMVTHEPARPRGPAGEMQAALDAYAAIDAHAVVIEPSRDSRPVCPPVNR